MIKFVKDQPPYMQQKLYFTQLDSLRFWAFFLVFWQHIKQYIDKNLVFFNQPGLGSFFDQLQPTGGIGVHVFFVISGFLITFLLIREEKLTGKINIRYFYLRRILRIWPLYYLVILIGIFVLSSLSNEFTFNRNYGLNLLFLNNFDVFGQAPNIAIAWSVAIEEQFYLFWPILFLLIRNKNVLMIVSAVMFIFSIGFIIFYPSIEKYHTFGNLNYLMIGCIGGILFSKHEEKIKKLKLFRPINITFAILVALLLMIGSAYSPLLKGGSVVYLSALIGLPIIYLYIIINLVIRTQKAKIGFISRLGKYTYGMYLYHPIFLIGIKIIFDRLEISYLNNIYMIMLMGAISLVITIGVSYLSYECFEKHILKFKTKFSFVKTRI